MDLKLNAKQLRKIDIDRYKEQKPQLKKNNIYIILDNVLDTYNIGSVFRLADAAAVKKVYLCAGSVTPPNPRIMKASINTTEWVEWEYCATAKEAIERVKSLESGVKVVAVEQSEKSVPYDRFGYCLPVALVVGHETDGVSPEALALADAVVDLPMYGVNISLNVVVSLGIVLYRVLSQTTPN